MGGLGDDALEYANRGIRIFPLRPRDKRPLTTHGFKEATADEAQILEWWDKWPDANIGLVTGAISGCWVLDLDGDADALLNARNIALPQTPTSRTGGGGKHILFKHPGRVVPNGDLR